MSAPPQQHLPDDLRLPEGRLGRYDPDAAVRLLAGVVGELARDLAAVGVGEWSLVARLYKLGDVASLCDARHKREEAAS